MPLTVDRPRRRVLAVASGGGHWVQLQRLAAAFEGHELTYATVLDGHRHEVGEANFAVLPDASRWSRLGLVTLAWSTFRLVRRTRPDVVISTGAAPGCFAIIAGKLSGARTVWVDSIANAEHVSLSARVARPFSDLWLTQWQHLARPEGPEYRGAVI